MIERQLRGSFSFHRRDLEALGETRFASQVTWTVTFGEYCTGQTEMKPKQLDLKQLKKCKPNSRQPTRFTDHHSLPTRLRVVGQL